MLNEINGTASMTVSMSIREQLRKLAVSRKWGYNALLEDMIRVYSERR